MGESPDLFTQLTVAPNLINSWMALTFPSEAAIWIGRVP